MKIHVPTTYINSTIDVIIPAEFCHNYIYTIYSSSSRYFKHHLRSIAAATTSVLYIIIYDNFMMAIQNNEMNVRRLALYLRPGKYCQGIKYVEKMNKCFSERDVSGFLTYLLKYIKVVRHDDDVAKFRAMKMIDKCYGTFMVKYLT